MRKVTILLFCLLWAANIAAQNPFAPYGYKVKVATMTNGRFPEFHDLRDTVQIGSVLYNVQTGKVIRFLETDTSVYDVPSHVASRFITPDPHAERYYNISPYAYANNNPIVNIDPDGMDWYSYQEQYKDENNEIQTRTQYMYYSGVMSDDDMAAGGYTHIGETVSFDNGDGTFTNFYQNVGLKSDQVFNAKEYMLENGLVGKYAYDKNSPLDDYARVDLAQASIHKGQDDFLNHEATQFVIQFLPTRGIFSLDKKLERLGFGQGRGNSKGERKFTKSASGTDNPYKHLRPDPNKPGWVLERHPQTGKWISKPAPPGYTPKSK